MATQDEGIKRSRRRLLLACLLYAAVAGIWVLASDMLLVPMTGAPDWLAGVHAYGDWLFVAVSAAMLYAVGRKSANAAFTGSRVPARQNYEIEQTAIPASKLQLMVFAGSVLLVAVMLLFVSYSQRASREAVLQQGRVTAENLVHIIEAQTINALESVELTMHSLNGAMELTQSAGSGKNSALKVLMREMVGALTHVRKLFVLNERGDVILDSGSSPATLIKHADRDYFIAHRENPAMGLLIGAPATDSKGKTLIALSRRISKANGEFGGVMVAEMEADYFHGLYNALNVGKDGVVLLSLRNGVLLLRASRSARETPQTSNLSAFLMQRLEKLTSGTYIGTSQIDGLRRIYSYRTFHVNYPLVVLVGLSEREILAGWYRTSRDEWLAMLLFILTMGMLVFALTTQLRRREALTSALISGERRYRYLFNENPSPMWLRDIESRRIVDVNRAAILLYGYSREEFLELKVEELYLPEELERRNDYLKQRSMEADSTATWRHKKKDGSVIDVEISSRYFVVDRRGARLTQLKDVTDKRRAEQALRNSEERYRYLFEANPQPMWLYDYETLVFLAVNDAMISMYGYSKEELLSMSVLDIRPEAEIDRTIKWIKSSSATENHAGIWTHVKKDGSLIHVDIVSHGCDFEGRKARLVLANNVTERLQMEIALRDSELRLRTITDNIPALIGYVDSDLRYRFANRTYVTWHGDTPEQLYGKTLREVVGDEYYEQIKPEIANVLSGRAVTFERLTRSRIRELYARITYHPDFGSDGRVKGFYILGYDITERKQAEEALAREKTLLRQVIDNLPDRINVKDRARRYLLLNMASLKARNISVHDEIVGKSVFDFSPPDLAAKYDAEDAAILESGEPLLNREQCTIQSDGGKTWHLTTKVPLRNSGGAIIGIVSINRDITELKRGQETIRELNTLLEQRVIERTAQLESANKELEAFSYSVSHDLRAPLRSIDGFSLALLEDFKDSLDKTAVDYLQRVRSASQRMSDLIDDLLELSRITRREMHREVVDMGMLAQEIVADLRKENPQRAVDVRIAPGIRLQADVNLMRIALDNLIRNAWKFTGKQAHPVIEIGKGLQAGNTVYFVRDNGVGFDENYAGKLFGAFQRLHSEADFPGTGIGLATVQRVVRRHGGNIWAEAEPGKGATFFFTMGSAADSWHHFGRENKRQ